MKWIGATLAAAIVAANGIAHAHGGATHAQEDAGMRKVQKAWGIAADAQAVTRTIDIAMLDEMRFAPGTIDLREGETVRLVMRNTGRLLHELVLGTQKDLDEHAALMARFPGMQHDEPYMAHVAPGDTGEVLWTFNRRGSFQYACLVAGHYQAGMRGTITVAASEPRGGTVVLAQADTTMTDGEVRKVDRENRKITLRHAEIRNLDMPAMTMVFQVKDPALLDRVKPGDKVRFHAEQVNGALVVTAIEPAH